MSRLNLNTSKIPFLKRREIANRVTQMQMQESMQEMDGLKSRMSGLRMAVKALLTGKVEGKLHLMLINLKTA